MAITAEVPHEPFRLSMLWYDKRYRSNVIQILVLVGVLSFFGYLINNAANALAAQQKTFGFSFLFLPASYDINQTLIPYTSSDTHLRATIVGILNTGLVAIVGIFIATILGFILGVLRLSSNWLVSRLVYWYVEFTRNVPLLLQILFWHGIFINSFPHPRAYRDVEGSIFLTNRGIITPKPLLDDAIWFVVAALVVGIVGAVIYAQRARRKQEATGQISPVFRVGLGLIIGLPLVAYFLAGMPVSFDYPAFQGFNFRGGMTISPELASLTFALAIYTAAFISENVRAGILAVSHGQTEAAYALGLRPNRTMNLIIIPQALRVIIPPLTSQYLNLTKNSSLAIAIGYMDVVATLGGITLMQTGKELETNILLMAFYLSISLTISMLMNWYNRSIAFKER
ncbi:MAG: ABC transporter permease subunit [Pseudomonadota bacterium]